MDDVTCTYEFLTSFGGIHLDHEKSAGDYVVCWLQYVTPVMSNKILAEARRQQLEIDNERWVFLALNLLFCHGPSSDICLVQLLTAVCFFVVIGSLYNFVMRF